MAGGSLRWSLRLIAFGNQWSFYDSALLDILTVLGASYKFYGVVLLTLVVLSCLLRRYPSPAAGRAAVTEG